MPVDFQFDRLKIERFRGIREFELQFVPKVSTYLIGGNNTGKSTVLNALALVLRGGGFHTFEPSEFDFFRESTGNSADDFAISLYFKATAPDLLPAVQGVGNPTPVYGIRVVGQRKKDRLRHRHVLLDEEDKQITLSPRTALKSPTKEKYKDHGLGWAQPYARLDDIRKFLPEVWLLRPDNLEGSLYHWKTGPLQRLTAVLSGKFLETKWDVEYDGKSRTMPGAMEKAHHFFRGAVQQFPFWKNNLKPLLEGSLSRYLGRSASVGLQPDVQTLKDWLTQQLAVSFSADAGGPMTPLQAMGDGWQALVRLAALETLQKLETAKTGSFCAPSD